METPCTGVCSGDEDGPTGEVDLRDLRNPVELGSEVKKIIESHVDRQNSSRQAEQVRKRPNNPFDTTASIFDNFPVRHAPHNETY